LESSRRLIIYCLFSLFNGDSLGLHYLLPYILVFSWCAIPLGMVIAVAGYVARIGGNAKKDHPSISKGTSDDGKGPVPDFKPRSRLFSANSQ
jgi:hypothetical protein